MNENNCKKFCGNTADFYCAECLQRIVEELIRRKLIKIQENVQEGKRKIQGYYIWKEELEDKKEW